MPQNRLARRWRKLRRDPIRYFADSHHAPLRVGALGSMALITCLADCLCSPLRTLRCLGASVMPRRSRLVPNPDLIASPEGWESRGENPRFAVKSKPGLRQGGWTLLVLKVADRGIRLDPLIYAEGGQGCEGETAVRLPSLVSGAVRCLVRLPPRVDALGFRPLSGPGRFRIEHFDVRPVTAFGAYRHLRRSEGKSLPEALRALRRPGPRHAPLHVTRQRSKKAQRADLQLLRQSPWFDAEHYLDRNQDVADAGHDPAEHYYFHGAAEGRDPGPAFDTLFYLTSNPDVAGSSFNPLVHYIRYGQKEGRQPTPDAGHLAPKPKAPAEAAWRDLPGRGAARQPAPVVDVIVPVYRGADDTLACIHSVLAARVEAPFELVVIDDHSPEPALSAALGELARHGLLTLLVNERNRGFVGTVNRGMALHRDRDVVLLNADTVVYGDWLDRLRRQARAQPDVATVTPFSNNATICSYPFSNRNNRSLLELGYDALDGLAARVNAGRAVELPTGVGFCLYISRASIEQLGVFDQDHFGRGYGEENDFCRRAAERGWRNLMACDVFVRHTGEVSFTTSAAKARRRGMRALLRKHPDYARIVARFVAEDPVAPLRRRLDTARLVRAGGGRAMLFVSHRRGGGVERHLRDMAEALADDGVGVLVLRASRGGGATVTLNAVEELSLPNLNPIDLRRDFDALVGVLAEAGVFHVHVHSLADHGAEAVNLVPQIAARLGVAYDFTVHDYIPACPRINLIDTSGVYCGEKGVQACRTCLGRGSSPFGKVDIEAWRQGYGGFLAGARAVFVPSEDVLRRMSGYFPAVDFVLRPHPERPDAPGHCLAAPRAAGEPLRAAIIGAIGRHKGSRVLLDCARDAAARKLPLEFVLIGHSDIDSALGKLPNVTVTGAYREEEAHALIERHRCHLAFFPAVCPETFSYTLTSAFAAGLYPVAFDIGAIAERVRARNWGRLLPLELTGDVGQINDALLTAELGAGPCRSGEDLRESSSPMVGLTYYGLAPLAEHRPAADDRDRYPAERDRRSGEGGNPMIDPRPDQGEVSPADLGVAKYR